MQQLKASELAMAKSLKAGTPALRAIVTAVCILVDIAPEKTAGAAAADKKVGD